MGALIEWQSLTVGEHRFVCVVCGNGSRKKNLSLTVNPDGSAVAHCFKCGYVETHRPQRGPRRWQMTAPRSIAKPKREELSDYGWQVWRETLAIAEQTAGVFNVARAYLQARQCVIPPVDGDLRWHPALRHAPSGHVGPGLVALVTHAVTREPMTLHFTWVNADGTKAAIEPARMLLGGHRKAGGVIRLWPDEAVTYGLGIGEGVESTLTLARVLQPVWACIDAGNLAAFPALPGIELLTIAADNDEPGLKAARTCAQRWADAGAMARIVVAPTKGADLNDFVRTAA